MDKIPLKMLVKFLKKDQNYLFVFCIHLRNGEVQ